MARKEYEFRSLVERATEGHVGSPLPHERVASIPFQAHTVQSALTEAEIMTYTPMWAS
jgi:hypothetical protein